jgi:uncharacterized protein (TIGR04255 family)
VSDFRSCEQEMNKEALPEYSSPPAVETLMGFFFQKLPVPPWGVLRLGQLWQEFATDYPKAHLLPPIGVTTYNIPIGNAPIDVPLRANFIDEQTNELIQVQDSAFFRNWRTINGGDYARFSRLLPLFRRDWDKFLDFLSSKKIDVPAVYLCEVTYVNHLVRNRDWNNFEDLSLLLKPLAKMSNGSDTDSFLRNQVSLSFSLAYLLEESNVALEISASPLVRPQDSMQVFQVTITAKGSISQDSADAKWKMINSCHEAVVLGFTDIITTAAQEKFGRSR